MLAVLPRSVRDLVAGLMIAAELVRDVSFSFSKTSLSFSVSG
jgi:hypothetical protein